MKILVTGNKNGLGRYLFEELEAKGWDKDTAEGEKAALQREGVDVIVHCAFNSAPEVASEALFAYVQDNLFLTKELTEVPHKKFIFISSVDVYPKNDAAHQEDEIINANEVQGIYAITKLMAESIVKASCLNYLIMRCSAFLGPYMRKNSLKKILEDEKPQITLTQDSELNVVRYQDVFEFIQIAIAKDLQGVYNIASSENMKLGEIAEMVGKKVTFGTFLYKVGNSENRKASALVTALEKTSQERIREFANL